jgi:hypothetical protein
MYKESKVKEIPVLGFLESGIQSGHKWYFYVGPKLSFREHVKLRNINPKGNLLLYIYDACDDPSKEQLSYTFPGICFPENFSLQTIFADIKNAIGGDVGPDSKLLISHDGESFVVFNGGISTDLLISYLVNNETEIRYQVITDFQRCLKREVRYRTELSDDSKPCPEPTETTEDESDTDGILFRMSDTTVDEEGSEYSSSQFDADMQFDSEMMKAAKEVEEQVKKLLYDGFPGVFIESWLKKYSSPGRLRITRQFKILLVDYDKEVKMGPLPKTVFLFYLRHREGVMFSHLQDHIEELKYIYGHVSVNDDPQKMEESIAKLTDPFNNSICEKCAAIKKAFLLQVNDHIARHYYITGYQGGPKWITLDRDLVEWECEL